jgi:hypothetical protein
LCYKALAVFRYARLFVLLVIAGGIGAFAGSVLGAAFGRRGLFAGGYIGGVIGAVGAGWLAARLEWIQRDERAGTMAGAAIGFIVAATIAINTLSSPVGPLLSTLLIGAGGLAGQRLLARRSN